MSEDQRSVDQDSAGGGLTSLGVSLVARPDGRWFVDLSDMRLFTGLSVIARTLADELLEQSRAGVVDAYVQRRLVSDISPDLVALGVGSITVYALDGSLRGAAAAPEEFHTQLRTVLGTLQRPRWASQLFAPPEANSRPLLFPFHSVFEQQEIDYFFLVELDRSARFMRISVERVGSGRIDLQRLQPVVIDDLHMRTYIQGLSRMAQSVHLGILRECEASRTEFSDTARRNVHFFSQLTRAGLPDCDSLTVHWPAEANELLVRADYSVSIDFLKRVFIVLEDRTIVERLLAGDAIEIRSRRLRAFLDLSRRGRCLNISLFEARDAANIEYYQKRMPALAALGERRRGELSGWRIFLIHHITSEILGVIKTLDALGAERLHTLFVKYAGSTPSDYLEALLTLPEDRFRFSSLQKIESSTSVDGYYLISRQYSPIDDLAALEAELEINKLDFFSAMSLCAGQLFLREAAAARKARQRLLVIEDGGYLMPMLNDLALQGVSVEAALQHFALSPAELGIGSADSELQSSLVEWLSPVLCGSIEHTRNGLNRLEAVCLQRGRLQWPAATIAVSDLKRNRESQEVSVSILHAVESILHGLGLVLSERRALVLGSCGAIGRNLMEDLFARLGAGRVSGVDLVETHDADVGSEARRVRDLSELSERSLLESDLILGVIGESILTEPWLEKLVADHRRRSIFFASGSTKTAEFTHLIEWLRRLQTSAAPQIGGVPVSLQQELVRDPQTAHITGKRIEIRFDDGRRRSLYLLGGLTPINFLFYGVPTETMDAILAQLLQLSLGLIQQNRSSNLPARALAVDRDIDADCRPLA
ncbi:MAG: hypothetical protein K1X75_11780 [Leptospirales bacterium]|nr:hypothetical protein [Leptospirales bacterium]